MCCARTRGFSLVEALVAASLLVLLLTLILQVVIPMGKGSVRGGQQIELQQLAFLAAGKLRADLEATPPAGLTLVPPVSPGDDFLLAMHRLEDVDAQAGQVYALDLIAWKWMPGPRQLWRETWPPVPPTLSGAPLTSEPFVPGPADLAQILSVSNRRERMIAREVVEFDLTVTGLQARLHLALEAPAPDGRPPERFELDQSVYLRNTRY